MATVTVLSTKTQKKYSDIQVEGNTLGQLKTVLSQKGIDYSGMTFFEGRTRTELSTDQSTFPDNAVIRLSKSEKRITSGIEFDSRNECYAYIKTTPELAAQIKSKTGKNYTNVGTADLIQLCVAYVKKSAKTAASTIPADAPIQPAGCSCASSKEAWVKEGISKGYINAADAKLLGTKVEEITAADEAMFNWCK